MPGNSSSPDALPLHGWPFKPQSMMSPQTARAGRGTAGLRMDCISQQSGVRHTLPSRHGPRRTINRPGAGFQGDSKCLPILWDESGVPGVGVGVGGWSRPDLRAWHSTGPPAACLSSVPASRANSGVRHLPLRSPSRNPELSTTGTPAPLCSPLLSGCPQGQPWVPAAPFKRGGDYNSQRPPGGS